MTNQEYSKLKIGDKIIDEFSGTLFEVGIVLVDLVVLKDLSDGTRWNFHKDEIIADFSYYKTLNKTDHNESGCPLCGNKGDNLVFAFYCSNEGCKNYRE